MAWTAPRTWVDGELVTAAIMNTHVRDNLNATSPHLVVRTTSDQSVISSTTLVNHTTLVLPVGAGDVWAVEFLLYWQGGTAGDLKVAFTHPSGTLAMRGPGLDASSIWVENEFNTTSSPTASRDWGAISASVPRTQVISGLYVGGSAGNLQLQFAQVSVEAVNTTIKTHSTLWAVKLA